MIRGSPSLLTWSVSEPRPVGIDSFVDRFASTYVFYGSGKAALRDGLATLSTTREAESDRRRSVTPHRQIETGVRERADGFVPPSARHTENVLVPSYIPDAVIEPIRELGIEPRFYRITEELAPDMSDLESRLDENTLALTTVNYFGLPQSGLDEVRTLLDERDCYHVDDNAHSALSVDGETLLGTRGTIGITSLRKLLPIPNGALLYLNDDAVAARYVESDIAGVNDRLDGTDCRFILKSLARDALGTTDSIRHSIDTLIPDLTRDGSAVDPATRYQSRKRRMSKLAYRVITDADPDAIRRKRRANFEAWLRVLSGREDVAPMVTSLADGICPQVFPVRATKPSRLLAELDERGVSAHTWPRLASAVESEPAYDTARELSRSVVVLPVHQHINPGSIYEAMDVTTP